MAFDIDIDRFAAINDRYVTPYDFNKIFSDVLDVSSYSKLMPKKINNDEMKYGSNESFWQDIIEDKIYEGKYISLKEFHLTEWIPLSPGKYFLPESEKNRDEAKQYFYSRELEYLPTGKNYMVLGGIGSLRLSSKQINFKRYFFLGATSNGVTHQGIPIAIEEDDYKKLIGKIKDEGGCLCNISGSLEIIPKSISIIQFEGKIPKYYLLTDKIEFIDFSQKNVLASTIAIMFPSNYTSKIVEIGDYKTNLYKSWSFCYFNPSSRESFNKAIHWLNDYALRYSRMDNPPIFSDFDEYYNHFSNPIEFPLKSLGKGIVDFGKINIYKECYGFTVNYTEIKGDVIMGDVFKNIQNATIINKSLVENSFNKIKKEYDENTSQALLQIAEFIEKSGNRSAGILFDQFNEEINKPQSNKSTIREIWDGIEKTLPSIKELSGIITNIAPLFL